MSPKDMATVYKNTDSLTFDGFIRNLYTSFGMSKEGIRLMWQTHPSKSLDTRTPSTKQFHLGEGIHREQLYPGTQLDDITGKYLDQIQQRLAWHRIPGSVVSAVPEGGKRVSLHDWCADVLGHVATNALYGDALLDLEPRLLEYFYTFDQESWKLTFQLPPLFASTMYNAMENARDAYIRYFQLPRHKRSGMCYYLRKVEEKQRQAGMSDADIGIAAQMFFWGLVLVLLCHYPLIILLIFQISANANPFKICFWLLSYLIYDFELLEAIRQEVAPCITADGKVDIQSLLEHCPHLEASFHETLRVTSINSSARDIEAPVMVGNKILQPGGKLLMPYRQLHLEEDVFGPETKMFNPDRFLKNEALSRSPYFNPFGGGSTFCSGRFIAKRQVMAFVASVVHMYDLRLQDPKQAFPRMDETKPTLGIMDPVKGNSVNLVISPRAQAQTQG